MQLKEPILPPSQKELSALYYAAEIGDIMGIRKRVTQFESSGSEFALFTAHLRQLSDSCQLAAIREFLTPHLARE